MNIDPEQLTVVALMFGIGAAGLKRLWVWGWTYAEEVARGVETKEDRDFWRDIALQSMGNVEHAIKQQASK